ncbi:MAG: protein kinase [Planctomycetota bacterium]
MTARPARAWLMPTERDDSFARALVRLDLSDEQTVRDCLKTVADTGDSLADVVVREGVIDAEAADRALRESRLADAPAIDGYRILDSLGEGGMGTVWKAQQVSLDRVVALKVLPPALSRAEKLVERFRREALATARLNHPNIVAAIDVGRQERPGEADLYYFVMEYVDGESVDDVVRRDGPIEPRRAARIAIDVARALDHAWTEAGIVHRDIKPANILISRKGVVKLADLGLARSVRETAGLTTAGLPLGTPHYVSPEQAEGRTDLDARSDIYSLGATLFHMLTGGPPFDGDSPAAIMARHVNEDAPAPHDVDRSVPLMLSAVVQKMMDRDPGRRYRSPGEAAEELERFVRGDRPLAYTRMADAYESVHGRPPFEAPPPSATQMLEAAGFRRRPRRPFNRAALIGTLLFLAGAGLAAWYAQDRLGSVGERLFGSKDRAAPAGPARAEGGRGGGAPPVAAEGRPLTVSLVVADPACILKSQSVLPVELGARSRIKLSVTTAGRARVAVIRAYNGAAGEGIVLDPLVPGRGERARRLDGARARFPASDEFYPMPPAGESVAYVVLAAERGLDRAELVRAAGRTARALRDAGLTSLPPIPERIPQSWRTYEAGGTPKPPLKRFLNINISRTLL